MRDATASHTAVNGKMGVDAEDPRAALTPSTVGCVRIRRETP